MNIADVIAAGFSAVFAVILWVKEGRKDRAAAAGYAMLALGFAECTYDAVTPGRVGSFGMPLHATGMIGLIASAYGSRQANS